MLIFPKLIYPLTNLPILIKHNDIKKLDSVLNSFIWSGKKPKIALSKLRGPYALGGLKLPNFRIFNLAAITRYLIEWTFKGDKFTNPALELFPTSTSHILNILHLKWKDVPFECKVNPLFRDSIFTWKLLFSSHNFNHMQTPFMPIHLLWKNSQPGYYSLLSLSKKRHPLMIRDFVDPTNGKLLSWAVLKRQLGLKIGDHFLYIIVKSAFLSVANKNLYAIQKHWLAEELAKIEDNWGILNIDYITWKLWCPPFRIMHPLKDAALKWTNYLHCEITPSQLSSSITKFNKYFTSEDWRVQHFKLIHLEYGKLFRKSRGLGHVSFCPKCKHENVDLFHYFWD
ncbi:uncharacterized protein LOC121394534 [Xenopus laevis]|uniref:Uncharacterized protein LOC121394534 n=1 Tax=Xenopus laevis TaxID=8355 RepID=A0A8J1KWX1_XENLA|nr:uncharacterized protein LOC121394534 [Xenopus laevis]